MSRFLPRCFCTPLMFLLLLAATVATAQNCQPPPLFSVAYQSQASLVTQGNDPDVACALSVAFSPGAQATAAAFVHYQRPVPASSLRFGFRIDTSVITPEANLPRIWAQIFSLSAMNIVRNSESPAHLLRIGLLGMGQASPPAMVIAAASGSSAQYCCEVLVRTTQNINTLRLQVDSGAGVAGKVSYWLNANYSDPPTGVLDNDGVGLDNAAWGGIIAAELGLSSASPHFLSTVVGPIVFDQIETSDDLLFWDNFSSR